MNFDYRLIIEFIYVFEKLTENCLITLRDALQISVAGPIVITSTIPTCKYVCS